MCHHRKYRVASGPCEADVGPSEVKLHVKVVRPDDDDDAGSDDGDGGDNFDDDADDSDVELEVVPPPVVQLWLEVVPGSKGVVEVVAPVAKQVLMV